MDLVTAAAGDAVEVAGLPVTSAEEPLRRRVQIAEFAEWARTRPATDRWVWADSAELYPRLLSAGVRVRRAVDLRLCRAILRRAGLVGGDGSGAGADESVWDAEPALGTELAGASMAMSMSMSAAARGEAALFELAGRGGPGLEACVEEHQAQQRALAAAGDVGRLALLCHAESIGGLMAQELNHTGVPFSAEVHDAQLTALLGPREPRGGRPGEMARLAREIQQVLGAPTLNPDSPADVLAQLRQAGLDVASTRQWELEQLDHPVIAPLLAYKKLSRLHTANGWAWLESWVHDGRFRPDWVAGGVVTGRWASRGGGALQLPKQIRAAVRADPGWQLVVADAAQLEPRVLAAMARDEQMARAASAGDLYRALVDQGVVQTRAHAKVAMLGAMYGATSGEAGALLPRLARAYPRAIGLVESAARAGERGEQVRTWLGRTSPPPAAWWWQAQQGAQQPGSGPATERRARQASREWGRFTRNFVVQGTAAEWALCWMGHLRRALSDAGRRAELVYFLHDEVIVHAPQKEAEEVAAAVRAAAEAAGALLFGTFPVEFPLEVAIVTGYDQAH